MDMEMADLVVAFDLGEEVGGFVRRRVRELAEGKEEFSFEGGGRRCRNEAPHVPHVVGLYKTVRYGMLQRFCLGQKGPVEGGELRIVVEYSVIGCAEWPSKKRGFWFVHRKGEGDDG